MKKNSYILIGLFTYITEINFSLVCVIQVTFNSNIIVEQYSIVFYFFPSVICDCSKNTIRVKNKFYQYIDWLPWLPEVISLSKDGNCTAKPRQ